ncbi:ABC transporter permease [Flavobacterium faecale]|uniref:ABC transporter permease n=1 Tax=Flavobacterium faecale TaxID=1355330 RepID=UPI003AABD06B
MRIKHITEISYAIMFARWRQTLIAAIGVTFSIALFVALLGFMEGLNRLLDGMILNRTPHVRLYNDIKHSTNQPIDLSTDYLQYHNFVHSIKPDNARKEIYNAGEIINALSTDKRLLGIAPKVTAQVFYSLGAINLNGVINGVDIEQEAKLFSLNDYIIGGNYLDLINISNSIILGKGAANKMQAELGDVITITTTGGEQFSLKVVGFFQSGIAELDNVQSYASLSTTRKLLGVSTSYINEIQIKLHDMNQAPAIAREYEKLFELDAEDIQTANADFETGSSVRSTISYAVGITLLIISGFGIYNILNMMIYEKMDTIAILKATGFAGSDVKQIFITIALSIGIAGAIAGAIFGFLLCLAIDSIPFNTAALPTITTYPVDYNILYYLIAVTFATITTYLSGWFPAQKASKMDPVIIIRGK